MHLNMKLHFYVRKIYLEIKKHMLWAEQNMFYYDRMQPQKKTYKFAYKLNHVHFLLNPCMVLLIYFPVWRFSLFPYPIYRDTFPSKWKAEVAGVPEGNRTDWNPFPAETELCSCEIHLLLQWAPGSSPPPQRTLAWLNINTDSQKDDVVAQY